MRQQRHSSCFLSWHLSLCDKLGRVRGSDPINVRQNFALRLRGVRVPARNARVSLCMIVRDEERNLEACLASVADLFDEIVIVDTGSLDRTKEIARQFNARVFDFEWSDD